MSTTLYCPNGHTIWRDDSPTAKLHVDSYHCPTCDETYDVEDLSVVVEPAPAPVLELLVEHSCASAHWSPSDALECATKTLKELGSRTLIVAFIDSHGEIQVQRAGTDAMITLLAMKVARFEISCWNPDPDPDSS